MATSLHDHLAALSATTARPGAPAPATPAPEVLADRPDGTVVRSGPTVAKAHAPDGDPHDLATRL
ncbi:aminoglycoside phosphotransferase family protein, partial [Streptomyces sp. DSM 41527]|nr:aminoglycoside phosphotransferase family protein [Streptomyces sp. DSM 41527]